MTLRRDIGQKISDLAKALTPDEVAEMVANRWFCLACKMAGQNTKRTPISIIHWPLYRRMVRSGLMTWERNSPDAAYSGADWRLPTLTLLGERVLLAIAEDAMMRVGAMASDEDDQELDA